MCHMSKSEINWCWQSIWPELWPLFRVVTQQGPGTDLHSHRESRSVWERSAGTRSSVCV